MQKDGSAANGVAMIRPPADDILGKLTFERPAAQTDRLNGSAGKCGYTGSHTRSVVGRRDEPKNVLNSPGQELIEHPHDLLPVGPLKLDNRLWRQVILVDRNNRCGADDDRIESENRGQIGYFDVAFDLTRRARHANMHEPQPVGIVPYRRA